MPKPTKKPAPVKLLTHSPAFLCMAMNGDSPTGNFRDSAGYDMLLQRSYAAQRQHAREMDAHLGVSPEQDSASHPDIDAE